MLRTIIAAALLTLLILAAGLPLLLVASLLGTIGVLYPAAAGCLRASLALAGVRVRAEGRENIPGVACLFLANHTSAVDPVAILLSAPRRILFMAKGELFRIPLLGRAMRLAGFLAVDRASRKDSLRSAERAIERLRAGDSMVIYPEGTRSAGGRLGAFKRGAFLIAIRAAVPVVPVTISGAEAVLPRGEWRLRPGKISVRFHPSIDAAGCRPEDRESLLKRVRAAISSALPEAGR